MKYMMVLVALFLSACNDKETKEDLICVETIQQVMFIQVGTATVPIFYPVCLRYEKPTIKGN